MDLEGFEHAVQAPRPDSELTVVQENHRIIEKVQRIGRINVAHDVGDGVAGKLYGSVDERMVVPVATNYETALHLRVTL